MRALTSALALALGLSTLALACSSGADATAKERLRETRAGPAAATFDWTVPARALELTADEVAARLGAFDWTAAVEWTVAREGDDARRVRAVERHRVRQAATGEFEVQADIDPGLGAGSETGREIVFTSGMTYARGRFAPFRERPTDRGRDARRFRDESFLAPRSLVRLVGPRLEVRADGEVQVHRRPARRFVVSLAKADPAPAPAPAAAPTGPDATADVDTKLRRAFLAGLRPASAAGELLLDAQTGAPLRVRLTASFTVEGEPAARATAELLAQVNGIGGEVQAIAPPKNALPDERKAAGVAGALEAAGLKKRGDATKGRGEPAEDGAEE